MSLSRLEICVVIAREYISVYYKDNYMKRAYNSIVQIV